MKRNKSVPIWKECSTVELVGLILIIPIAIIIFDVVLGLMFRGFAQANSESTLKKLLHALYLCFGTTASIYIYKLRKCFLVISSSCSVLFILYLLLFKTFTANDTGMLLENILTEIVWIYAAFTAFVLFFRFTEFKLDYAEARDMVEVNDEKANLKITRAVCSRCEQPTILSQEKERGGRKEINWFCQSCGRYIRGNPLTNTVLGLALSAVSVLFMYGMNAGNHRSAGATLNLLFAIILYLGIKSLYLGITSTYRAIADKDRRRTL